jgi:hypothetical protein
MCDIIGHIFLVFVPSFYHREPEILGISLCFVIHKKVL